ncbi:response regulator [Thiomicrospira microaerophila]|uniref:response regulator transcription factor n=1 Tax=Thiomicrospira microaerophila TaxID=406020 RepID=UPI00200D1AD1|nr:response regulator [Thiomicrospira microaerophila]UQB43185.1 response regulator [Thiomicrospira microaerophila]
MEQKDLPILIVDDDPAINAILGLVLENQGYPTYSAITTDQAQQQLSLHPIAIVLLDLGLPPDEHTPKQGLALLDWIQTHYPSMQVLVLTGQADTAYESIKLGAFDYLNKPIEEIDILRAVQRAALFYQQTEKMHQQGLQSLRIQAEMGEGVKAIRNQAEEKILRQVLYQCQFNIHEAARRLGLKRENVYYLINKYAIQRQTSESD